MESLYLILIVLLFLLAISDLIVGVSNDAVNFLNAAIGSKAASFKIIMVVAALGIVFGSTFSMGMMEVARKGIFHPQYFYFSEIIFIFLAVMITDVILLDGFNTFGMPTSTTVSIVFELLGAAVGVSLIKLAVPGGQLITTEDGVEKIARLSDYINSGKALMIIAGILLSVVVAFTTGAIIQYLSRLLFSFKYEKRLKYFGALWGGLAITAITYFILLKGLNGSSFAHYEMSNGMVLTDWVKSHTLGIIAYGFILWVIILQLLSYIKKFNIFTFIVFIGTFALALAFAGNDLVNFIGVPLAGYHAYIDFSQSGVPANELLMTSLAGKVHTPFYFMLAAGLIMVVTLWTSKKAKSVIKTSVDLGRQEEGYERFESTAVSRAIVRGSGNLSKFLGNVVPKSVQVSLNKQFDQTAFREKQKALGTEAPAFDMIRASVTLVVASILIAIGTALKLPLSTTYVTFMVAMGTSLTDRAWGTESAVYRVTGVISVIGGWFFTAFSAFTSAFIMALLFSYFGLAAVFAMLLLAGFMVYRTHFLHKRRVADIAETTEDEEEESETLNTSKIVNKASKNVIKTLDRIGEFLNNTILYFGKEDLKKLRRTYSDFEKVNLKTKSLKDNISHTIDKLEDSAVESGHYYVQVVGYLREISHAAFHIIQPVFKHLANSHRAFLPVQVEEIKAIQSLINDLISKVDKAIKNQDFTSLDKIVDEQLETLDLIRATRKLQVKRIKTDDLGTRNSMLFFNILEEYKNIILYMINLLKSHRDFINFVDGNGENASDEI